LSLAIADDIGAILVIAIGYSSGIRADWLAMGLVAMAAVYGCQRMGVRGIAAYAALGVFTWYAFLQSGVHATIAGVILGLMTPARSRLRQQSSPSTLRRVAEVLEGEEWSGQSHRAEKVRHFQRVVGGTISPLEYLEGTLHPWVAFLIMPVFALANAGVEVHLSDLRSSVALAVILGLVLGKPAGILLATLASVKSGLATLPERTSWAMTAAGGALSGIGFTMALFIATLALDESLLPTGKIGVLAGSVVSAAAGMVLILLFSHPLRGRRD